MIIIIPLHIPLGYPSDYIDQTAKILSRNNSIIFFDYHRPYQWKNLLDLNNLKKLKNSFIDIFKLKGIIYFRAPSIFPFSRFDKIVNLNKKLGFYFLSFILWFYKKKVVIWQFSTLITNKVFKKQLFVYDCVDFINSDDKARKFFYDESKLFKICDLVSFNSKGLFENKSKMHPTLAQKSIISVCGYSNNLFRPEVKKIPKEYINIPQKKIVFMGVFDRRVDTELLRSIVTKNQNLKFILIGPIRKDAPKIFNKIKKEKNLLYLGEKNKNELPLYLKNCDLGIIPYNAKSKLVKYSNPMKAYEYLGSGLPVVSTRILALENLPKDIVYIANNEEEFNQGIKKLINNWNDKRRILAEMIAEKNSWENKINTIEKIINKNEKTN